MAGARLKALLLVARDHKPLEVAIDDWTGSVRVLLVAGNAYSLNAFSLGARDRLDEGLLHLYAAESILPHTWEELPARAALTLGGRQASLEAAADGEPVRLELPCRVWIEPRALRVLVPGGAPDEPRASARA